MKIFSIQYFDELFNLANRSQRLRLHVNLHYSYLDPCQKLFNVIKLNSYICPHRHKADSKDELLLAVKGLFGLIIFNHQGIIESIQLFGSEKYIDKPSIAMGLEVPSDAWHTVIALVDNSILFEVKNGPFRPEHSKEFAPWAPKEGAKNAYAYFVKLKKECLKQLEAT